MIYLEIFTPYPRSEFTYVVGDDHHYDYDEDRPAPNYPRDYADEDGEYRYHPVPDVAARLEAILEEQIGTVRVREVPCCHGYELLVDGRLYDFISDATAASILIDHERSGPAVAAALNELRDRHRAAA